MKTDYRLLTSKDINLYRQIRLECLQKYPEYFGTIYEDEVKAKSLKFDKALQTQDSNDFLYGAFQGNNLISICGFTREVRIKISHLGEISHMYIKEEISGQGIGTQLLKYTIDKAFKDFSLEQIMLSVVNTNEKAIKIYERIGFIQYGILDNYFKRNEKYWTLIFMSLTRENYFKSKL